MIPAEWEPLLVLNWRYQNPYIWPKIKRLWSKNPTYKGYLILFIAGRRDSKDNGNLRVLPPPMPTCPRKQGPIAAGFRRFRTCGAAMPGNASRPCRPTAPGVCNGGAGFKTVNGWRVLPWIPVSTILLEESTMEKRLETGKLCLNVPDILEHLVFVTCVTQKNSTYSLNRKHICCNM